MLVPDDFAEAYDEYLTTTAAPAEQALTELIQRWTREGEYWVRYAAEDSSNSIPNPIYASRVRIKRPEQIVDKIQRMPEEFPAGVSPESLRAMYDVVGARVVVFFRSHLSMIDEEIRSHEQLELSKEQTPKAYTPPHILQASGLDPAQFRVRERKFSGYSSLHYIVRPNVAAAPGIWCELQVRTLAEELWAEVEHQLGYKPDKRTMLSVKRQFRVLSDHLAAIDAHLDFLYQELKDLQSESQPDRSDPLNAENLPTVLSEFNVRVIQRELRPMLSILEDHNVNSVGALLDRLEGGSIEFMRTHLLLKGLKADAFSIVANAAFLPAHPSEVEIERQVRVMAQLSARRRGRPRDIG